jgi:hypothetical protein
MRRNKPLRWLRLLFAAVATSVFAMSCSEDEGESMPPMLMDFVEAHTDANCRVVKISSDAGRSFVVAQNITAGVADTTYRCVCRYTLDESESNADIFSLQHIYSLPPFPKSDFEKHPAAPVTVSSVWKGGDYINLILKVLTTGKGTHSFAFCEEGFADNADGKKIVNVTVLHERPQGDAESYTQDVYMSIPMGDYACQCDSIAVNIPTYQGVKTFMFEI